MFFEGGKWSKITRQGVSFESSSASSRQRAENSTNFEEARESTSGVRG